jgi:protocatechuate 3,4-dioxygenase, alpha subunit
MSGDLIQIPAGSQTVGPYFRIGLDYLIERTPALTLETAGTIEIRGRVSDCDGAPVPDAMLEFWSTPKVGDKLGRDGEAGVFPAGFRRAATDGDGNFLIVMARPATVRPGDKRAHAPHMLVLVFARGLLRHLVTRVYFGDEQANQSDPVLMTIPQERRATLIAQPDETRANLYRWDIILQGTGETVFFAW